MKRCHAVLLFILSAVPSYAASVPAPSTLEEALAVAREKNPEIIRARQAWGVARARIRSAGAWPDPTFSYIDEKFPSGAEGTPPERIQHLRVEQPVLFPGKISAEARMKTHEARIAEAASRGAELEILSEVRMRYYQLFLTDQKIELALTSAEALRAVLKSAQARLASGQSSASDVFMAQTELRKMENQLFEQQQQRIIVQIELNTLLNRSTDNVWGPAAAPALVDLPAPLADMKAAARRFSPDCLGAMHEINHASAMEHRNRLAFAPDFGLMYERETSAEGAGRQIGVSATFPLWLRRPWGDIEAAKAHVVEARAMADESETQVMKMVHMEYVEVTTHLSEARNYEREILPAAQSTFKLAREQYASGRGDFLRMLEAFRIFIEAHNDYQEQVYHAGEHWSLLERWVGFPLGDVPSALKQKESPEEKHHDHD